MPLQNGIIIFGIVVEYFQTLSRPEKKEVKRRVL